MNTEFNDEREYDYEDQEQEQEDAYEQFARIAQRCLPYLLGLGILLTALSFVLKLASHVRDPGASTQWSSALECVYKESESQGAK